MKGPITFSISPRALAKSGVPIERLCTRAGVTLSKALVTRDFFRLWDAADDMLEDRSAGLRFGVEGVALGYSVAATVARHAPDFRHALTALSRYKRLTCPEIVEIEILGAEAIVRYRWLQASGEVPRLLVDMTMASLKEMARQETTGRVAPIRLELARRPADAALLRRHFGCPIVFGAVHDAMVFDIAALDVPFDCANGGAFAQVIAGFDKRIAEGDGFPMLDGQVRVAIARQLSEGRPPSIVEVARRLGISSRSLQRHLGSAKTSFQHLLSDVRRTIASRLLVHTDLDTVAIAMLLGFEEPNSFTRAFRHWEHTSPLRWRQQQTHS